VKEKFVPVLGALVPENVWAAAVKVSAMAETTATLIAICVFIKCVIYVYWDANLTSRSTSRKWNQRSKILRSDVRSRARHCE
jgi:hypothetical protein